MGLKSLFKLSKLTLEGYKDHARKKPVGPPSSLEVQYNPETLSVRYESVYTRPAGLGAASGRPSFVQRRGQRLDVALVFDGTQVDHLGVEALLGLPTVADRVRAFLELCYHVVGSTHEPAFLRLSWDRGVFDGGCFDCRLQSVEIQYTAFDRDGSPLHAELSAVFVEDLDPPKEAAKLALSSPDLTHRRVVRAGDTLPLLCIEIYGSASHTLRVAEVNGLDGFRVLRPGQELYFPPFAATEG